MYFRARYYDPNLGEFISRDPLGYVDGMSLYRAYFVPGGMDPLGLRHCGDFKYGTVLELYTAHDVPDDDAPNALIQGAREIRIKEEVIGSFDFNLERTFEGPACEGNCLCCITEIERSGTRYTTFVTVNATDGGVKIAQREYKVVWLDIDITTTAECQDADLKCPPPKKTTNIVDRDKPDKTIDFELGTY